MDPTRQVTNTKKISKMMPETNKKETGLEWKEDNSKHIIIVHSTDKDVLCGRGRTHLFHEGNRRFRGIVNASRQLYLATPSRGQKSKIVKAVVKEVLGQGARFLKQVRGGSCDSWYEAGLKEVRLKVSV